MTNIISGLKVAPLVPSAAENNDQLRSGNVQKSDGNVLPLKGKTLPHQVTRKEPIDSAELGQAVNQINQFIQSVQRDLSFSIDEGSGRNIIQVLDRASGEVVRQIPSEEVMALASLLENETLGTDSELPQGILFSDSI
jgi:flagellar protein FlaG